MTLTQRLAFILLTGFSAAMILGAWGFEFIGEMPPCKLCYYQRYPHWLATGAGLLAIVTGLSLFAYLAGAGAAASGLVGLYHTGVERKWWEGPTTCTSSDVSSMSADDLFDQIMTAPLVRCDEIPWQMFGLSMANYNALFSIGAAILWVYAVRKLT